MGEMLKKPWFWGEIGGLRVSCQLGDDREQHFFTWPQSITLPDQAALETLDIKVFGEGGKVILPPSPVPSVEDQFRWLVPPWESPPSPPTPRLMEFLERTFSGAESENRQAESDILTWEEIFAQIASHSPPDANPADAGDRVRRLLSERCCGKPEPAVCRISVCFWVSYGMRLWDRSRHEPNSLEWFKDLIKENDQDDIPDPRQMQNQLTDLIKELSKTLTELKERENLLKENFKNSYSCPPQPDHFRGENKSRPILSKHLDPEQAPPLSLSPDAKIERPSECFIKPSILPPAEIPVKPKQNEAMIDELGRLGAGQKYTNRIVREGDSLKAKIEAQRQEEINHLRQLVREQKNRKWW